MAFQAPPAGAVTITPSEVSGQVRSVPDLGKLLAVGSVATVQVAYDPTNQENLGNLYKGANYPALLPENVTTGAKLRVSVVENSDAVVLKILSAIQNTETKAGKLPSAALEKLYPNLMQDLNLLFSEESPKELNFVLAPLREEIRKFVVQTVTKEPQPSELEPHDTQVAPEDLLPEQPKIAEKKISAELERILDKVFSRGAILDSSTLDQPQKTFNALLESAKNSLFKNVTEAKDALQKLSGKNLPATEMQLLKTIETELEKVIENLPQAAQKLAITPQASNTKTSGTEIANPAVPLPSIDIPPEVEQQITLLHQVLKKIKIKALPGESNTQSEAQKIIFQLTSELEAPEIRKSAEAVKETLTKALKVLKEKFAIDKFTPEESKEIQTSMRALNGLESLLSAQDTLNQLNPVMDAMGEPILILFPMLTAGMLSKMKLSAEHPKVDPEEHKRKGAGGNDLTRIRFSLELPSVGAVEINLAHGKSEVYASFTFESEEMAEFATTQIEKLSSRFSALGYTSITLRATSGAPQDVTPNWVKDLTIKDGIFA